MESHSCNPSFAIMKSLTKTIVFALIIGLSFGTFTACSTQPEPVSAKRPEMPADYPKTSGPVLQKLSGAIPADSELLFFTSYGAITELIPAFEKHALVDSEDLHNTLNDLGKHYLLNPAKLRDYYNAGLNTGSGFVAGYRKQNLFFVLDTLDNDLFRHWLDNFINEEFGRPVYQESTDGNRTIVEISVLHKDFCTMIITPNEPIRIVMGPEIMPGSAPSRETANEILTSDKLGSRADQIALSASESPVSIWADANAPLTNKLPDNIQKLASEWLSGATLNFSFTEQGPELALSALYNDGSYQNVSRGKYITSLLSGTNAGHAPAIIHSNPVASFRCFANTETLESLLLPASPENIQNSYKDIKSKLTQKLLNINISEQVIYNIGAVWIALYQASAGTDHDSAGESDLTGGPDLNDLQTQLFNQNIAIYIPFKNAKNSDAFFGKLNILKRFIPEKYATIQQDENGLNASISYNQYKIHIGYHNGLIGVATDLSWPTVQQVLITSNAPDSASSLSDETQFLASHVDIRQISDLPFIQNTKYGDFAGKLAEKIRFMDIQSSSDDAMMHISVRFSPAK